MPGPGSAGAAALQRADYRLARGRRPVNAVNQDDAAVDAWLRRSLIITVHVDRLYGSLRFGSLPVEQMGYCP